MFIVVNDIIHIIVMYQRRIKNCPRLPWTAGNKNNSKLYFSEPNIFVVMNYAQIQEISSTIHIIKD